MRSQAALAHALIGVKVINLLIAKHEYLRSSVATCARPIGFMLDPANQCHLGCPSCVNSYNTKVVESNYNKWPRGLMSRETFGTFLREVGLYAFSGAFYNNHEPLLNRHTPEFLGLTSDLHVRTFHIVEPVVSTHRRRRDRRVRLDRADGRRGRCVAGCL